MDREAFQAFITSCHIADPTASDYDTTHLCTLYADGTLTMQKAGRLWLQRTEFGMNHIHIPAGVILPLGDIAYMSYESAKTLEKLSPA